MLCLAIEGFDCQSSVCLRMHCLLFRLQPYCVISQLLILSSKQVSTDASKYQLMAVAVAVDGQLRCRRPLPLALCVCNTEEHGRGDERERGFLIRLMRPLFLVCSRLSSRFKTSTKTNKSGSKVAEEASRTSTVLKHSREVGDKNKDVTTLEWNREGTLLATGGVEWGGVLYCTAVLCPKNVSALCSRGRVGRGQPKHASH